MKVLIIGGVAGGATLATRLRRLSEEIEIKIFERGPHVSFANCGLPYYVGNVIEKEESLIVQNPEKFKRVFNIDVFLNSEVLKIDRENKNIEVKNLFDGNTRKEYYDILVISTGAENIVPKNLNLKNTKNVFHLRNVPDTLKIKDTVNKNNVKEAIVIGGGYIGLEIAENLYNLGIKVTVIERAGSLMGPLDFEMSKFIYDYLIDKGIKVVLSNEVVDIQDIEEKTEVKLSDGNILKTDMVILSVGVKPESKLAIQSDLEVNNIGSIVVNEKMLTSDENIYALGDVAQIKNFITDEIDFIPLAGPANKQARVVANNICGLYSKYNGTQGSSIIKIFDMSVATTGINERKAKSKNLNYGKIYLTPPAHATYYPGATNIIIKVIYDMDTLIILGAQIFGKDGVDKRADVIATAIRGGLNAYDLCDLELCYAPPFSTAKDPVNIIGNIIVNIKEGNLENIYSEDLEEELENQIILDVRTKKEYELGNIKNSINIPLDTLREKIDILDKSKKIIVYCHSGQRSYNAYRILKNKGYNVVNLTGGYLIYKSVKSKK